MKKYINLNWEKLMSRPSLTTQLLAISKDLALNFLTFKV